MPGGAVGPRPRPLPRTARGRGRGSTRGRRTRLRREPRRRASSRRARVDGHEGTVEDPVTASSTRAGDTMSDDTTPVILAGARTPFGRFRGGLASLSGPELGAI